MTYVVLAAGASRRMGFPKAFTPLHGAAPLERIASLLAGRHGVAVVPPGHAAGAKRMAPALTIVVNAAPERGMAHSLRLALRAVERGEGFGVLLADKPFVRRETLELLERTLQACDVAYPVSENGAPGHPVLFAAAARAIALALPDGDTISLARDDVSLRCARVTVDDPGAFMDLDEPADWEAADA